MKREITASPYFEKHLRSERRASDESVRRERKNGRIAAANRKWNHQRFLHSRLTFLCAYAMIWTYKYRKRACFRFRYGGGNAGNRRKPAAPLPKLHVFLTDMLP